MKHCLDLEGRRKMSGNCVYFRKISVAKLLGTYNYVVYYVFRTKNSAMYKTLTKGNIDIHIYSDL